MKLKVKVAQYKGNGINAIKGDVFEVSDEEGKQLVKDFPKYFDNADSKAKKPSKKAKK